MFQNIIKYKLSKSKLIPLVEDFLSIKKEIHGQNKLDGKVCLVVGGNSGIGLSIVKTFLREGATVIATARKKGILDSIKSDKLHFIEWDIADTKASKTKLDYIYNQYNRIDISVLSAGVNTTPDINKNAYEQAKYELTYIHSINVIGICEICNYIKEKSIIKNSNDLPKIITIISAGALLSCTGSYFTSKYALLSFTKAFHKENKSTLRVYGIAPGEVKTKMIQKNNFTLFSTFAKDYRKAHPDEIAELALLMSSKAGDAMSGNIVVHDGGETILSQF